RLFRLTYVNPAYAGLPSIWATVSAHQPPDRGTSMASKPVALLLADLGITKSYSRPRCLNDNPYSEAQFRTGWLRCDRDMRTADGVNAADPQPKNSFAAVVSKGLTTTARLFMSPRTV